MFLTESDITDKYRDMGSENLYELCESEVLDLANGNESIDIGEAASAIASLENSTEFFDAIKNVDSIIILIG